MSEIAKPEGTTVLLLLNQAAVQKKVCVKNNNMGRGDKDGMNFYMRQPQNLEK